MSLAIESPPVPMQIDSEGVVRIGGTRVALDSVVIAFLEGATAEEIAQQYPSLRLADVYSVIGYYLHRRAEVDAYLDRRRRQAETVRAATEMRFDPAGVRARLLARQAGRGT